MLLTPVLFEGYELSTIARSRSAILAYNDSIDNITTEKKQLCRERFIADLCCLDLHYLGCSKNYLILNDFKLWHESKFKTFKLIILLNWWFLNWSFLSTYITSKGIGGFFLNTRHALREKCPNTELYRKIRNRNNSVFGQFSHSDAFAFTFHFHKNTKTSKENKPRNLIKYYPHKDNRNLCACHHFDLYLNHIKEWDWK